MAFITNPLRLQVRVRPRTGCSALVEFEDAAALTTLELVVAEQAACTTTSEPRVVKAYLDVVPGSNKHDSDIRSLPEKLWTLTNVGNLPIAATASCDDGVLKQDLTLLKFGGKALSEELLRDKPCPRHVRLRDALLSRSRIVLVVETGDNRSRDGKQALFIVPQLHVEAG